MLERKYFEKANDHQKMGFTTLGEIYTYVFATLTNHGICKKPRQLLILNPNYQFAIVRKDVTDWLFIVKETNVFQL